MKQLLLVNLGGHVYGIWEEDVLAKEELRELHHLPISPTHIAGVSLRHDHAITLADLSVCVGHAPLERKSSGRSLIMSDTEKIAGFAVAGELRRIEVESGSMHPLPDYLKTSGIDSCVIIDSMTVPVINIAVFYSRILKLDYRSFKPHLVVSETCQDNEDVERVRLFQVRDAWFAAPAKGMKNPVQKPEQITPLPQMPRFVVGITFHEGRVLTVVDLQHRIWGQATAGAEQMLVVELGMETFGFLVHADGSVLEKEDFRIRHLPPLAQSNWLRSTLGRADEIVPLLDLGALLSGGQKGAVERPLPERYHPDPGFLSVFNKKDTDVVEFLLLGQRHAIPKSEVKDVVGATAYREIPNVPEIVIGVAEVNEELLPVLDLAMVFGRRSLATPEWRMLKVSNGDFHALLITEAVFGERRLPLNIHREVPIKLPHLVVYGCYPDADSVRLILNVEALTVYFEKALVQELLPAMTPEMKQARAEIVPSLLGEVAALSSSERITEEIKEQPLLPMRPVAPQPAEPVVISSAEELPVAPEEEIAPIHATEPHIAPGPMPADEEISKAGPEEADLGAAEEAHEEVVQPSAEESIEEARPVNILQQETEALLMPGPVVEEAPVPEQAIEEPIPQHGEENIEQPLQEEIAPPPGEALVAEVTEADATEPTEEPTPEILPTEVSAKTAPVPVEPVKAPPVEEGAPAVTIRAAYHVEPQSLYHEEKEEQITRPIQQEQPPVLVKKSRFKTIGIAIAVVILVAIALLQVGARQKKKAAQAVKPAVESARPSEKLKPVKPKEPLVLTVPADVKIEIDRYIVKKGDTLWDISKRFTGNPFNYPGIAGENKIPDPDLIYPEQKIIIKRQEK